MDNSKLTGIAALIGAITALILGILNHLKQPEEPKAKASYTVISEAIEELSHEEESTRNDLVELRNYVSAMDCCKAVASASVAVPVPSMARSKPIIRRSQKAMPSPPAEKLLPDGL